MNIRDNKENKDERTENRERRLRKIGEQIAYKEKEQKEIWKKSGLLIGKGRLLDKVFGDAFRRWKLSGWKGRDVRKFRE